jgi:hypothetical protein
MFIVDPIFCACVPCDAGTRITNLFVRYDPVVFCRVYVCRTLACAWIEIMHGLITPDDVQYPKGVVLCI